MELNLKNKAALVCGSTQGIGRATAMALADEASANPPCPSPTHDATGLPMPPLWDRHVGCKGNYLFLELPNYPRQLGNKTADELAEYFSQFGKLYSQPSPTHNLFNNDFDRTGVSMTFDNSRMISVGFDLIEAIEI